MCSTPLADVMGALVRGNPPYRLICGGGAGYRITSVACSPDQTAVVLTTGAFAGKQEAPQETLRTTSFPAHHIKACQAGCRI